MIGVFGSTLTFWRRPCGVKTLTMLIVLIKSFIRLNFVLNLIFHWKFWYRSCSQRKIVRWWYANIEKSKWQLLLSGLFIIVFQYGCVLCQCLFLSIESPVKDSNFTKYSNLNELDVCLTIKMYTKWKMKWNNRKSEGQSCVRITE